MLNAKVDVLVVLIEPPDVELPTREVSEVPIGMTSELDGEIADRVFELVSKGGHGRGSRERCRSVLSSHWSGSREYAFW